MNNRRESKRSYTYAKVVISDFDIIGYARDISEEGLRLEILESVEIEERNEINATIIPHDELGMEPFKIRINIRWFRDNGPTVSMGIEISSFLTSHGKELFSSLLERFRAQV